MARYLYETPSVKLIDKEFLNEQGFYLNETNTNRYKYKNGYYESEDSKFLIKDDGDTYILCTHDYTFEYIDEILDLSEKDDLRKILCLEHRR